MEMERLNKHARNRIRDLELDLEAAERELCEAQERIRLLESALARQNQTGEDLQVA